MGSFSQEGHAPPNTVKTETTVRVEKKNGRTYTTTTTKYTLKNGGWKTKSMVQIS